MIIYPLKKGGVNKYVFIFENLPPKYYASLSKNHIFDARKNKLF